VYLLRPSTKRGVKMNITAKYISTILFASAAWMVCAVALPMNQAVETDGLMARVSNLLITEAYAKADKVTLCHVPNGNSGNPQTLSVADSAVDAHLTQHSGDYLGACVAAISDNSSSSGYDFSSDTLICVSRTSVETTLNISSESSDDKSSDKDDGKSSDDDKSSDKDDGKSSANESDSLMAKVYSLVIRPAYAKEDKKEKKEKEVKKEKEDEKAKKEKEDEKAKKEKEDNSSNSDDEGKSDDKGDSESSDSSSSTVTSSDLDALATCTALGQGGTQPGVWIPSTAVGDSAALTAYIQEVQAGGGSAPSRPESSMKSYRAIRGE